MPEHSDLLRNAIAIDQTLKAGTASVQPAIPKSLFKPEDDSFGGNDNNRRVAAKNEKAVEQKQEPVAAEGNAASVPPVTAPVATVVAPQSKQGKAAAKVAAPTWNPNA